MALGQLGELADVARGEKGEIGRQDEERIAAALLRPGAGSGRGRVVALRSGLEDGFEVVFRGQGQRGGVGGNDPARLDDAAGGRRGQDAPQHVRGQFLTGRVVEARAQPRFGQGQRLHRDRYSQPQITFPPANKPTPPRPIVADPLGFA